MAGNSVHHDASFMTAKIFLLHYISLQNYGTVPHTHMMVVVKVQQNLAW